MAAEWTTLFPDLGSGALATSIAQEGHEAHLAPGQFVCMEGDTCTHLALVTAGQVRVYKSSETGRELTLYRVHPGESCILTASCILSTRAFPAFAVVEADVTARLVPAATVRRWMRDHEPWRQYVFDLLVRRLTYVLEVLEDITFGRLDARLAHWLLGHALQPDIPITHEALAAELGSSREVISRLLKAFEQGGLVALGRGHLTVRDPHGLQNLVNRGR